MKKITQVKFETLVDENFIIKIEDSKNEIVYEVHEDYFICLAENSSKYCVQNLTLIKYNKITKEIDYFFVSEAGNDVYATFHYCVYLELFIYKNIHEFYE